MDQSLVRLNAVFNSDDQTMLFSSYSDYFEPPYHPVYTSNESWKGDFLLDREPVMPEGGS